MATAKFWQRGEALDYINSTEDAIAANNIVVIGSHLGVAGTNIEAGAVGSVHVVGVFEMPRTGSAAIAMGADLYWDGTAITDTAPGEGIKTPIGYAAAPADASATTVMVKLNG